jgi:hypothetical protein
MSAVNVLLSACDPESEFSASLQDGVFHCLKCLFVFPRTDWIKSPRPPRSASLQRIVGCCFLATAVAKSSPPLPSLPARAKSGPLGDPLGVGHCARFTESASADVIGFPVVAE